MRVAILGGTRFIGRKVAEIACDRGHRVTVLHRGIHCAPLPNGVTDVRVDRDDSAELSTALEKTKPDVLIDTFAMTKVQARKAMKACANSVESIVVLSSQDVYAQFGRLNGHPASMIESLVSETSPLTVPYPFRGVGTHEGGHDYDKKDVEALYREEGVRLFQSIAVLRLPAVFGSGDYQRRFGAVIDLLDSGAYTMPCQNSASWRWTQSHVTNAAHAIVLSAEKKLRGHHVFNVGDRETPTMRERIEKIARLMGARFEWKESDAIPKELGILGSMPNDFVVDTAKIRSHLGYEEILSPDQSYLDLIEWCRKTREPRVSPEPASLFD